MDKTAVAKQPQKSNLSTSNAGFLQRKCACGKQAVAGEECDTCKKKKSPLQRKLAIGASNDPLEQEADRIADRVVANSLYSQMKLSPLRIQRFAGHNEGSARTAPDSVERVISSPGKPLEPALREDFERRFGYDFSQVRIHVGENAERSARDVEAQAYTVGQNIVFGQGRFSPATSEGRHLLAHELTHVVQQSGSRPSQAAQSRENSGFPFNMSSARLLQRVCEVTPPPSDLACPEAVDSTGSGTPVLFGQDSSALSAADRGTLSAIAAAWHSGGGIATLRIDGFASCEGPAGRNWHLSCRRAQAVAAELEAPSDGSPGVPSSHITIFAHGETDQFSSSSLPPNRRVEITGGGAPPPGPPCPLTITGPDEVDHYCAAYVPSDAASCGVFPAPNIRLTGGGAGAGATLRWSITRGGAMASIVGTNTGAAVDIRGDAPSAAQGDVTVQVTDGTCSTTHALTVREPSQMSAAQSPSVSPASIRNTITYTVGDQFGNPMGANICVDETITQCANSHAVPFTFGDAGTNANGQVTDNLSLTFAGGIPASLCIKLDQTLTAGGCGPLLHNTILFQPTGITLTHGSSCAPGDPCP